MLVSEHVGVFGDDNADYGKDLELVDENGCKILLLLCPELKIKIKAPESDDNVSTLLKHQ